MALAALLPVSIRLPDHLLQTPVPGLTADSRTVKPGDVFFALTQNPAQRDQHIFMALEQGAQLVFYDSAEVTTIKKDHVIGVPDIRHVFGEAASRFYGEPAKKLRIIGVTGTNGKTSVCHLLAQAFTLLGKKVGVLGTAGNGIWPKLSPAELTTPDVLTLHARLQAFVKAGVSEVVMEVSSHGLDQARIAGVSFALGVFTNLSRDHLDYHRTMKAYAQAKRRFFDYPMQTAILNLDDRTARAWLKTWPITLPCRTYALKNPTADFQLRCMPQSVLPAPLWLFYGDYTVSLDTRLLGAFNYANLLAVMACLVELGFGNKLIEIIPKLQPIVGRMQLFTRPDKPSVVVDFAHTPDALQQALIALRPLVRGNLICIFGCGGDRDRGKRAKMAAAAEQYADQLVITNDNPRTESPARITDDIIAGLSPQARFEVILDRQRAITAAVTHARPGDVILVAGKGHEAYQLVGTERRAYSDLRVVKGLMGAK